MPDEWLTFFSALYRIPKSLAVKNTEEPEQTEAGSDKNSDIEDSETSWTTVRNAPMNCQFSNCIQSHSPWLQKNASS